MSESEEMYERVLPELISCYGEGEDTDWPYLSDLAELIVSMIERELAEARSALSVAEQATRRADEWYRLAQFRGAMLNLLPLDVYSQLEDAVVTARSQPAQPTKSQGA